MLRVRLVDGDDRVGERAVLRHRAEADHAGGRLLRPPDDAFDQVALLAVDRGHQVGAVVQGDLGAAVQRLVEVAIVGVVIFAPDGKGGNAVFNHESRCDIVLGAQRVAGAEDKLRAAVA